MHPKHDPANEWKALKKKLKDSGVLRHGGQRRLALFLCVNDSQISRWLKNGHPTEPPYSQGKQIERYLAARTNQVTCSFSRAELEALLAAAPVDEPIHVTITVGPSSTPQ